MTGGEKSLYVHILQPPQGSSYIFLANLKEKILKAVTFKDKIPVHFKQIPEGVFIYLDGVKMDPLDTIIELTD
jgi:alpha-L-fucosidase